MFLKKTGRWDPTTPKLQRVGSDGGVIARCPSRGTNPPEEWFSLINPLCGCSAGCMDNATGITAE